MPRAAGAQPDRGGAGAERTGSATPLPRKLGIAPASRVAALGAPVNLGALLGGVRVHTRLRGAFDVVLLFADREAALRRRLVEAHGALWIAWPKRGSGW